MPRQPNCDLACKEVAEYFNNKNSSKSIIGMEQDYSAHNYAPVKAVFSESRGVKVRDPEGKVFYDFLSGYGAVSHGHVHPRLVRAAVRQLKRCTLSSRAFYSDVFGVYAKFITTFFGYDRVLPMNTGAEGVETALKLARKWGYAKKNIPKDEALIICCENNFHGRTIAVISMSSDPTAYEGFGPMLPGFRRIRYGHAEDLEAILEKEGDKVCAFLAESIQGEAGVIIPPAGFFQRARELCTKHNVLMMCDEVQSGVGRSGRMLAIEHEGVRPDVVILAKALGGGVMPVAAVLADNEVMDVFAPGTHGSTFGGNPLACTVAIESLRVMHDEKLAEKSAVQGKKFLEGLEELKKKFNCIKAVRGRGLFCAIDFDEKLLDGKAAYIYMNLLKEQGVLTKITHETTLRISPPLIISDNEIKDGLKRMNKAAELLTEKISGKSKL